MTEMRWLIKVKYPKSPRDVRFYVIRKDIMERLLNWKEQLDKEFGEPSIYNIECSVVDGRFVGEDKYPLVAICTATTYGDLPWLRRARKPPAIEVERLFDKFRVKKEKLEEVKEIIKLLKIKE